MRSNFVKIYCWYKIQQWRRVWRSYWWFYESRFIWRVGELKRNKKISWLRERKDLLKVTLGLKTWSLFHRWKGIYRRGLLVYYLNVAGCYMESCHHVKRERHASWDPLCHAPNQYEDVTLKWAPYYIENVFTPKSECMENDMHLNVLRHSIRIWEIEFGFES